MAEINESSLSKQLEECQLQDEGKKKKKCRVKPRRHKKEKWSLNVSKTVLPDPEMLFGEAKSLEQLSRKLVKLLRWDLPSSGLAYCDNDASLMFFI